MSSAAWGATQRPAAVAPVEATSLAQRYRRYSGIAAVAIAAGWHGIYDLQGTLGGLSTYRWPMVVVVCWLVHTAVGAGYGVALLRGRRRGRPWAGGFAALAVSAGVSLATPAHALITPANWGWGSVGWIGVLVLWDRRLRELVVFLAANAGVMLVGLVCRGVTDRASMAAYLMVIVGSVTVQLGFGAGSRLLVATGEWVSARSAEQTVEAVERARADAVHAARLHLGRAIHRDTLPLLRQLADGADPGDPAIRHRCAVSAARLRRLLLEARAGTQPLTVELRSCADIAARAGAVVDLEVHGRVPPLDEPVRQALTEPALAVLAAARTRARVTVTAVDGEVVVSVLSDAENAEVPGPSAVGAVTVNRYQVGEGLWIESRWTRE
jgi:hypothetical protein